MALQLPHFDMESQPSDHLMKMTELQGCIAKLHLSREAPPLLGATSAPGWGRLRDEVSFAVSTRMPEGSSQKEEGESPPHKNIPENQGVSMEPRSRWRVRWFECLPSFSKSSSQSHLSSTPPTYRSSQWWGCSANIEGWCSDRASKEAVFWFHFKVCCSSHRPSKMATP